MLALETDQKRMGKIEFESQPTFIRTLCGRFAKRAVRYVLVH